MASLFSSFSESSGGMEETEVEVTVQIKLAPAEILCIKLIDVDEDTLILKGGKPWKVTKSYEELLKEINILLSQTYLTHTIKEP